MVSSTRYQYIAAVIVCFGNIPYGISCGWTSPTFPILMSDDTPIPSGPMTAEELSWVSSLICIGGMLGTWIYGYIVNCIGRKYSICLLAVPNLINFLLILYAQNLTYLIIGRLTVGIAAGGMYISVPIYIAETVEKQVRGQLGSKLILFGYWGYLTAFIVGHFFSYKTAAEIYIAVPIIYFIAVALLPETPVFLIQRNKIEEARKSLAFFRNVKKEQIAFDTNFKSEFANLYELHGEQKNGTSDDINVTWKDFTTRQSIKSIIIGIGLLALNQGCGCFAMLNYLATIFAEAGTSIEPNVGAMIVGCLQILGIFVSSTLVDRKGRKFCYILSCMGCIIGHCAMGIYQYMKLLGYDVSTVSWLPIASFSTVIFMAGLGILALPFVVIAEIVPEKIRAECQTICMTMLWLMAFVIVKYFYLLQAAIGMHGCAFLFAGICLMGAIVILVFLPETKGKSFAEIQKLL